MLKIGSIKLNTNVFLAPLAGCADLSFRLICREHGAGFCFYEMVDSNSLVRSSGKNHNILMTHAEDHPIAAQILGGDPEVTLEAARVLLAKAKPLFLDLNAACPAKKVLRKKAGAYLVREPRALCAIIERLASSLDVPITVKMRIGFDHVDLTGLVAMARNCEASGAAALFVHGRTCKQLYRGRVDHEAIRVVKQSVTIPVIGSGDVLSPELAKKMFDATGCDGVLVARGAMGDPWIFERIASYLKTGQKQAEVGLAQRKKVLLRHLAYMEKYRQSRPSNKIGLMRKIALLYLRSFPGAPGIRARITGVRDHRELVEVINGIRI